ncbi:uncharacterized protein EAE97_004677 [Botrytis byssoidea]|uniref:Fungal N-terminal domain-containing protein n=1 Tax=Botrytis byssoidea TaxID=139641 RepID=A0A9P5IL04_9HELO|nr:uncharacterized protein EAE97_004677 [Botrytis byssoidea]KAF7945639.1 hypothetical protein EAE97_004677 [Botrytis byssoidea]
MDGLSSASAVFAVVSVAVQLVETIHKLVDFWKAVEDAPDNIASIFRELALLSKILTKSHELAQLHSFPEIFDEALKDCCSKILKLHSKVENTRRNLNSSKLRKRKWAAWKIVLQKSEIDSLQKSISEAKTNILHIQVNNILARPPSITNVYQIFQQSSELSTQTSGKTQITEQQLANILTGKHIPSSLSAGCLDEKLVHFRPDPIEQRFTWQDDDKRCNQSPLECAVAASPKPRGIGSRKRNVYVYKRRQITGPFSNFWKESLISTEEVVHASGVKETVEEESQMIIYPSKWLAKLGVRYGIELSILASRGWRYSFQPFRAVPESSLIFQFCREGNLGGVRTLLSRGDASPYDRDPLGRTPLWYAAFHHQMDISTLLLSEGADVQVGEWTKRIKPIGALYLGECNDVKLKIAMAELLGRYDTEDEEFKYHIIQRFLLFFRHGKKLGLSYTERNEAALYIVQQIGFLYLRTPADLCMFLWSYILPWLYDGPVLQWVLHSVPGKIHNIEQRPILHEALKKGLLLRDSLGTKTLVDKTTTADLHLCFEGLSNYPSIWGETPTMLAMYSRRGFLVWRTILRDLEFDISDFVTRELAAMKSQYDGWTQDTLMELFEKDPPVSPLPEPDSQNLPGFHDCDRCQQLMFRGAIHQKVDLEWRRTLRSIRTGKKDVQIVDHDSSLAGEISATIIDRTDKNTTETSFDPLPYRLVCPNDCEDGVCVAWEYEGFEPPSFPPYIPKEERERLRQLRLAEEEAKCPTYNMPGAFTVQ